MTYAFETLAPHRHTASPAHRAVSCAAPKPVSSAASPVRLSQQAATVRALQVNHSTLVGVTTEMLVWWFGEGVMGTSAQPASASRPHPAGPHSRFPNYLCALGASSLLPSVALFAVSTALHGLRLALPLLCTRLRRSSSSRLTATILTCCRTRSEGLPVHIQSSACPSGPGTLGLSRVCAHMGAACPAGFGTPRTTPASRSSAARPARCRPARAPPWVPRAVGMPPVGVQALGLGPARTPQSGPRARGCAPSAYMHLRAQCTGRDVQSPAALFPKGSFALCACLMHGGAATLAGG